MRRRTPPRDWRGGVLLCLGRPPFPQHDPSAGYAMEEVTGGRLVPPDMGRPPAAQTIRGLPLWRKVAGGWFVPPDVGRPPAAQPMRGRWLARAPGLRSPSSRTTQPRPPAVWFNPGDAIERSLAPVEAPGGGSERLKGAPRRGASTPSCVLRILRPLRGRTEMRILPPGVFDPGLRHLRRLRRRPPSATSSNAAKRASQDCNGAAPLPLPRTVFPRHEPTAGYRYGEGSRGMVRAPGSHPSSRGMIHPRATRVHDRHLRRLRRRSRWPYSPSLLIVRSSPRYTRSSSP